MKQHPRNIMYKGLPENQSLDSELQRNICFFSSQGTIMQKDKGCPRPWEEAIAGQAETTDPAILTVEDCVPLHRKEQYQRETMLTWHTGLVPGCCSFALQHTSGLYCKSCQLKIYSSPLAPFHQDVLGMLWKHLFSWALVSIIQVLFLLCIPEWFSVWYQDLWTEYT